MFVSLLQHKYVSIAEVQIKREEELQQCPMTLVGNMPHAALFNAVNWPTSNPEPQMKLHSLRMCFVKSTVSSHVCCLAQGEEEVEETPAEMLYLGMLPNLSQYVVSGS